MGFSLGDGLGAIATGGISLLPGLLGGGEEKAQQVPLETAEQRAARQSLLNAANTGGFGNLKFGSAIDGFTAGDALTGWTPGQGLPGFNAGETYGGPLGNYDLSGLESSGLGRVMQAMNSGNPALFNTGEKALTDLLTGDKFDPYAANSEFAPFREALDRETRDAQDAVKRNAAFSGNLYSTNTLRSQADVLDRANTTKAGKLAQLFSEYTGRKINAIPLAFQGAQTGENIQRGRTEDAFRYGGLPRSLADTAAQRSYSEWQRAREESLSDATRRNSELYSDATRRRGEVVSDANRRRSEQFTPLDLLKNVAGQNTQFGVPDVSIPQSNPWMDLLTTVINGGSRIIGSRAAA